MQLYGHLAEQSTTEGGHGSAGHAMLMTRLEDAVVVQDEDPLVGHHYLAFVFLGFTNTDTHDIVDMTTNINGAYIDY